MADDAAVPALVERTLNMPPPTPDPARAKEAFTPDTATTSTTPSTSSASSTTTSTTKKRKRKPKTEEQLDEDRNKGPKSVIWRTSLVPRQLTDPEQLEFRLAYIDRAEASRQAEFERKVQDGTVAERVRLIAQQVSLASEQKTEREIMRRLLGLEAEAKVAIAAAAT